MHLLLLLRRRWTGPSPPGRSPGEACAPTPTFTLGKAWLLQRRQRCTSARCGPPAAAAPPAPGGGRAGKEMSSQHEPGPAPAAAGSNPDCSGRTAMPREVHDRSCGMTSSTRPLPSIGALTHVSALELAPIHRHMPKLFASVLRPPRKPALCRVRAYWQARGCPGPPAAQSADGFENSMLRTGWRSMSPDRPALIALANSGGPHPAGWIFPPAPPAGMRDGVEQHQLFNAAILNALRIAGPDRTPWEAQAKTASRTTCLLPGPLPRCTGNRRYRPYRQRGCRSCRCTSPMMFMTSQKLAFWRRLSTMARPICSFGRKSSRARADRADVRRNDDEIVMVIDRFVIELIGSST